MVLVILRIITRVLEILAQGISEKLWCIPPEDYIVAAEEAVRQAEAAKRAFDKVAKKIGSGAGEEAPKFAAKEVEKRAVAFKEVKKRAKQNMLITKYLNLQIEVIQ